MSFFLRFAQVIIVDNYCTLDGAKRDVQEFFSNKLGLDAVNISKKGPCMYYWEKADEETK